MPSTFLGFSTTAASNTDVNGTNIQGTSSVSNFDDALRETWAILRRDLDGRMVLSSKSAGYTAVADDNNAVIRFSAAATLSLTAAATLGAGWHVDVVANGGDVVIDPNGSETIDGRTTLTVRDGSTALVICDGTNFRTNLQADQRVPRGHLNGLTLSNNASDATNDIDIATGEAASDGTIPYLMVLGSALTKRLDAAWAVGTGNGGLDTGTIANGTYHVWLIQRSDTGVVDALFSTSATSPTMPTNYDRKRRIGSIVRASAAILAFSQDNDTFLLKTPVRDVNVTNLSTTAVLYPLSVPTGIKVGALISAFTSHASATTLIYMSSPDQTDVAPSATAYTAFSPVAAVGSPFNVEIRTDTSGQIRARSQSTTTTLSVVTCGWKDTRGRG